MSAKKYFGAFCLYLNYLVHGIGVLVMSLNVHEFEVQWQTDAAGVSVVISSLGLGRLALLVLAGSLSDKYGRRPVLLVALMLFLLSTAGCIFSENILQFIALRFLQGVSGAGGVVLSRSIAADKYSARELAGVLAVIGGINLSLIHI